MLRTLMVECGYSNLQDNTDMLEIILRICEHDVTCPARIQMTLDSRGLPAVGGILFNRDVLQTDG